MILAILSASAVWFIAAGILFFNPLTDRAYRSQENQPGVRALPKSPKTIGMILAAILIQIVLWAFVYTLVSSALPGSNLQKGLLFGMIIAFVKIIPRDIDRILLSTYPRKRMAIEFIIGIICALAIGIVFGYML